MGISNYERRIAKEELNKNSLNNKALNHQSEKRDIMRKACEKDASVLISGLETIDCVIKNTSESGAKIFLAEAVCLPDTITIAFPKIDMRLEARVMWQTGLEAGLMLI